MDIMEKLAVAAPPSAEKIEGMEETGFRIRGAGLAAGGAVAATLLSAILFTPVTYGEWMTVLWLLPQALLTAAVAGCWVCAAVSTAQSEK